MQDLLSWKSQRIVALKSENDALKAENKILKEMAKVVDDAAFLFSRCADSDDFLAFIESGETDFIKWWDKNEAKNDT